MRGHPEPPFPSIPPVRAGADRPFWSVMIPTRGRTTYLEAALTSVLQQDPGPEDMQIEVVDNASGSEVETLVKRVGGTRVSLYRQPAPVPMSENWNTCLRRGHGQWLHLLHDDDLVLLGYYQRLQDAIEGEPSLGAAFCRHVYIDADDHWQSLSPLERRTPGVLANWVATIGMAQRVQASAIVVRRSVYERLGGFSPALAYAPDWEMWKRIAVHYPVWFEPMLLACYRIHEESVTSQGVRSGANVSDTRRAIELSAAYLPPDCSRELSRRAAEHYALQAIVTARKMLAGPDWPGAFTQVREALKCSRSRSVLVAIARFAVAACARAGRRTVERGPERQA